MPRWLRAALMLAFIFALAWSLSAPGYAAFRQAAPSEQGTAAPTGTTWVVAGSFQDDLPGSGCGEWDNACAGTTMEDTDGDGVFRFIGENLPAGSYEYKIVETGNWGNAHPPSNVPFTADGSQVRWYFQPGPNNVADNQSRCIATVAGSFQDVLGGPEWAPDNLRSMMWQDEPGSDWYEFTAALPAGDWEYKVARDEAWDASYPANNVMLSLATDTEVTFRYNCATNEVRDSVNNPSGEPEVGDNDIAYDGLRHDSRGDAYRQPYGATPYNETVTLRFRTLASDVERVQVRIYNLARGSERFYDLEATAEQPNPVAPFYPFQWWEVTLPAPEQHTILYYRFLITDGTLTAYYEDDDAFDGGVGEAGTSSNDRSWNIYYYEPGYDVPEWARNAVIYQIFPERFRNGDSSNDPTDDPSSNDGWFYPQERGHRFPITPWNSIVPDPEPYDPANPWFQTYSSTMYGGDLSGILDKLDYLQAMGVTTIYLNPIFDSPSNHKYDGRDFQRIDPNFGDLALFQSLAAEMHSRDMYLVLDLVPNHVSSDSPWFDRFGRWDDETYGAGACESETSPYRDWFFFVPPTDPDNPKCAGGVDYRGWFGVETLPQVNTGHPDVLAYWFEGFEGQQDTLTYWLDQGADGYRVDVVPDVVGVNPTFFETWRDHLEATGHGPNDPNPAMSYSETWGEGDVRERVLGDEFDSTMNYRFRNALLGFLRDTPFTDDDFTISPLTPSEFESAMRTIQEDYPAPAFESAMNLTGSHDTNRPVVVLDHDGVDYSVTPPQPVNGFTDGRNRMVLLSVIQFTMPGAPTLYYGDEVGLAGIGSDIGRDDPYNRQPYPWSDEPGYNDLPTWRRADAELLNHYREIGRLRGEKSYLRTGSWDTIFVNDDQGILAYGRKDSTGAALITINRSGSTQSVNLDIDGYIPLGATLERQLGDGASTTAGPVLSFDIPPNDFRIWTTAPGTDMSQPAIPQITNVVEHEGAVTLTIQNLLGEATHNVFRSVISGGGYEWVGATTGSTFTDTGLINGTRYYYVATRVGANGLESGRSAEVEAIPHYAIDWANLQWPPSITHTISAITPTVNIYGQIYIDGVTNQPGATPSIIAQVGYGPDGTTPGAGWIWFPTTFNADSGNNDEFQGTLLPDAVDTYDYAYRYSTTDGREWLNADLDGVGNGYDPAQAGHLIVQASSDTTAPAAPGNLREKSRNASRIVVEWDAPADSDVHHYHIYRDAALLGTIPAPATEYADETVITDESYTYTITAVDTSFNESDPSNAVTITAEQREVEVTWLVTVPEWTTLSDPDYKVYIPGNNSDVFGQTWNPNAQVMEQVGPYTWQYSATVLEGTELQYKYTRGEWDKVEWWGTITGLTNRSVTISYGSNGVQHIHDEVRNWRDLMVVEYSPTNATAPFSEITLTFNREVQTATIDFADFAVLSVGTEPVTGTWSYETVPNPATGDTHAPNATRFTFVADEPLGTFAAYTVRIEPGMLGVGNDSTSLREVLALPVGAATRTHILYLPLLGVREVYSERPTTPRR